MPPRHHAGSVGRAAGALLGAACFTAAATRAAAQDGLPMPGKPFTTTLSGDGGPSIGVTWPGTPGTSTMDVNYLTDVDQYAVCNDGSPAAYYMAPGSGAGANLWLVYLEGSMFCWDESSCQERYQDHLYWMSSSGWTSTMAQGGIFATDGSSAWGTANRIYLKYCSSDFWSGDVAASSATFNFNFRGARIVAATITDLLENKGMGSQPGARLLFGGCSAGAIGAMNNIDAVAAQLPPTVSMQGFLDAAALLDIAPTGWTWSSQLETLQSLMAQVVAFIEPVFPTYCTDKYPGAESYKCLIGQYRMPLITAVPFFINAPQFDEFELMYDTDNFAPADPAQMAFVEEFQTGTLALIASLPAGTGVYSPTCLVHCLSGQPTFGDLTVNGNTLSQALSSWYFQGESTKVVSSCQGWDCVNACGIIGPGNSNGGLPCNMGTQGCEPIQLGTDANGVVTLPPTQQGQGSDIEDAATDVATTPAPVSAVEPALGSAQLNALTDFLATKLTTSRRLYAAAPACCNGRAA